MKSKKRKKRTVGARIKRRDRGPAIDKTMCGMLFCERKSAYVLSIRSNGMYPSYLCYECVCITYDLCVKTEPDLHITRLPRNE